MNKHKVIDKVLSDIYQEFARCNNDSNMIDLDTLPERLMLAQYSLTIIEVSRHLAFTAPDLGIVETNAEKRRHLQYICYMMRKAQKYITLYQLGLWTPDREKE